MGSCPAIDSDPEPYVLATRLADCRASLELIRPVAERYPVVIMAMSWTRYENLVGFLDASFSTIRRFAIEGKQVVILGKVPEIPDYDRRCRENALRHPMLGCPRWAAPVHREIEAMNARLRAFAEGVPNVAYFDVTKPLCGSGVCSSFDAEGRALYYDSRHLTMEASPELGRGIAERDGVPAAFRKIASQGRVATTPGP